MPTGSKGMINQLSNKSMMTANFEPMHHTLLEVVEYFEQLEVIESEKKAREPQKADVLLWYTKLQEIIKKKSCESPEAMFTLTELLLLVGQGQSTFKECRREVCENPVSSTDPIVRGIPDESYTMTMKKFKAKAFKKFAAIRQVAYLRNNLRKPLEVSIRTCSTRLTEMDNYLRLFPGPDSNVPLGEGDLIDILVRMVPTTWHESMMTTNFEPMHHNLLEVVEYFEQLEVIESAKKAREPQKAKKG